jgi:hypothetical protein
VLFLGVGSGIAAGAGKGWQQQAALDSDDTWIACRGGDGKNDKARTGGQAGFSGGLKMHYILYIYSSLSFSFFMCMVEGAKCKETIGVKWAPCPGEEAAT